MGLDIVFDQDGYPVQRTARTGMLALAIQGPRHGQRVRVQLDHRIEGWSAPVDRFNPGQILPGEGHGTESPFLQASLKLIDGDLIQFRRLDPRGCSTRGRRATGHSYTRAGYAAEDRCFEK